MPPPRSRYSPAGLIVRALTALCLVVVSTFVAASPAQAASTCSPGGTIGMGKYYLNNNLWGQNSGSGWQCTWDNWQSGSTIGWGTAWDWSGQPNSVKSFSSAVLGWHWGWRNSNTGLPVQISQNRSVPTGWSYQVSQSGTMNTAWDLWLHTIPNPTWEHNPTDEIMIWPYRAGGALPAGTWQATVNIGGTNWDLYRGWIDAGNGIGWNVFSFVRTSNTSELTINLRDFLNHLVSRGWVSSSKYLTSIQAGTEVFIGNGRVDTHWYYADIN